MRPKLNVKAQEGLKFYFNGKFQVLGLLARDIVIQSYCAPKTPLTKALNPLRWLINNRTIEEPIRCLLHGGLRVEKCLAHKTYFRSVATGGFCKKIKLQFTNLYIHSVMMYAFPVFHIFLL